MKNVTCPPLALFIFNAVLLITLYMCIYGVFAFCIGFVEGASGSYESNETMYGVALLLSLIITAIIAIVKRNALFLKADKQFSCNYS